jgi:hypothetical protein
VPIATEEAPAPVEASAVALRPPDQAGFVAKCRETAVKHERVGKHLQRECEKAGVEHGARFWYASSREAELAARICEAVMQLAKARAVQELRLRGLDLFASALEEGDFEAWLY